MKKLGILLLAVIMMLSLVGCQKEPKKEEEPEDQSEESEKTDDGSRKEEQEPAGDGILVVYFSRTGEQYQVGVIDEGNTAIIAKMIAEKTGADMYEILPEQDYYPYTYAELTDVAKKEQNEKARPAYQKKDVDLSEYGTIFIGAPVWWGDWPMIMYTFFESEDLSSKTLIPFCTHEGSGMSGFDKKLASACPNSTVSEGLAIRGNEAQNQRDSAASKVNTWLATLGY